MLKFIVSLRSNKFGMLKEEILRQIKPGATVAVQDKFGTFKGIVLGRKHGNEIGATFIVRATVAGVGVEKIYPSKEELEKVLRSGKKLRLYQGFDPSMSSLHLGNFAGLMKLRQFQKLGHEIIFLIGDFTAMIGDPDKLSVRKPLTRQQTRQNSEKWRNQARNIIDFEGTNPAKLVYNSEWLDKVSFKDLIEITSKFTTQQMLERDMFQKRMGEGRPVYLHELLYPVAQAYDSVIMDVDLEIGGNDQTFNMLTGRTLMKALKDKEKYVLTTKLLVDAEENKVGKTTGNALFLDSTPENFYGGIMSFPDEVIALSFELLTEVELEGNEEKIKADPMGEKKRLAFEVVKLLWGEESAQKAQEEFERTFQKRDVPENISEIEIKNKPIELVDLVATTALVSLSEAKRLITQGAVDIDGNCVNDPHQKIIPENGMAGKIGKTRFFKLKVK